MATKKRKPKEEEDSVWEDLGEKKEEEKKKGKKKRQRRGGKPLAQDLRSEPYPSTNKRVDLPFEGCTRNWRHGHDRLKIAVMDDGQVVAISINIKKSLTRLEELLEWVRYQKRPPDIIAIQDPPLQFAYKDLGNYDRFYRVAGDVELTREDAPSYKPYRASYGKAAREARQAEREAKERMEEAKRKGEPIPKKDSKDLTKVAFMVHFSVPCWFVTVPEGPNNAILATLHLTTSYRSIALHNLYNHLDTLNVEDLIKVLQTATECHILVGDFNLHHPLWSGDQIKRMWKKARELVEQLDNNLMICRNEAGVTTWSRGETDTKTQESVIDLVFAAADINELVAYELLQKIRGFTSDHRLTRVSIHVNVERPVLERLAWHYTPVARYDAFVAKKLKELFGKAEAVGPLKGQAAVERIRRIIDEVLVPAINEFVPVCIQFEPKEPEDEHKHRPMRPPKNTAKSARKKWRNHVQRKLRTRDGIFLLARGAAIWDVPKIMRRTPDFKVDGIIYRSAKEKIKSFVSTIWSGGWEFIGEPSSSEPSVETSGDWEDVEEFSSSKPSATTSHPKISTASNFTTAEASSATANPAGPTRILPKPTFAEDREQLSSDTQLHDGELSRLIREAPSHKTSGGDTVAYEALKMCRETLVPYLEGPFNTCLAEGILPDMFKRTITLAILKPGKKANEPKSYRPIALLSCVGKLLERIVADRLSKLAREHNLLPGVQFGAPGRSTTLALEHLINTVHNGWLRDQVVSLLGLDLTGAYDHVVRETLLEKLKLMGIPNSLILFTWSFLSNRRTTVRLPGEPEAAEDEFRITIGIPQGSPFSPILFLFYSAPVLTDFQAGYPPGVITILSYVDDTYVIGASVNRREVCRILKEVHEYLYQWCRGPTINLFFSPKKYHVFNFIKPGPGLKRRERDSEMIPDIPGFDKDNLTEAERKELCPNTLVILGVKFDRKLTFADHVNDIQRKVYLDLSRFRRLSGPTWGATLIQNRTLWLSKCFTRFAYAAPAWFMHNPMGPTYRFGLSPNVIKQLSSIQTECLLFIAGAPSNTNSHALQSEMHIIPVVIGLHARAMTHRCKMLFSPEYLRMHSDRIHTRKGTKALIRADILSILEDHPYHQLSQLANECVKDLKEWSNNQRRLPEAEFKKIWFSAKSDVKLHEKKSLLTKDFWKWRSLQMASERHTEYLYQRRFEGKFFYPAFQIGFRAHTLSLYHYLDRAQGTMAILMRTGNNALNANPIYRRKQGIEETTCPRCSDEKEQQQCRDDQQQHPKKEHLHTVEHLLCHCTALAEQRKHLMEACGHNNFHLFMTSDIEIATSWAIQYFELEQFRKVKLKKKHQFPRPRTHNVET